MSKAFASKQPSTSSQASATTATATEATTSGFSLDGLLAGFGAGSPATPAAPIAVPRLVQGKAGYVYQQAPDGVITIMAGPKRVGEVHAPGDPVCDAITSEIGPYVSPIPAAPAPGGTPAPSGGGLAGIIETISDTVSGFFGGETPATPEAPASEAPVAAPATTNPAFADGTRSVEGSTLAVAGSRLDMNTMYELDAAHGLSAAEREAMTSGSADAASFFCSGFSEWTLAASGYDVTEPIRGADGVPYSYTDKNSPEKPGKEVTLSRLINGEPESVTTMVEAKKLGMTNGGWVMFIDAANVRAGYETGLTTGDGTAELATKGAVGAFELAGIGAEVPETEQRPGDFAQSRYTNRAKDPDVATHAGAGHAWQVWSIAVVGSAMFGLEGSPKPKSGSLTGWHSGVELVIDDLTDPDLVADDIVVQTAERIEANIAGARGGSQSTRDGEAQDAGGDGGVGITRHLAVPDSEGPKNYDNYVVFYGRLSSSKWANWTPAKPPGT